MAEQYVDLTGIYFPIYVLFQNFPIGDHFNLTKGAATLKNTVLDSFRPRYTTYCCTLICQIVGKNAKRRISKRR